MATEVRYVVISDLHLGDRDSILTHGNEDGPDPTRPGAVLVDLAACLRELLAGSERRPTLIVNGDFLDLAFGSMANALMSFERFAELTLAPGEELFDEVLYLPGNHDHHMWEIAREHDYHERLPPGRSGGLTAGPPRPQQDVGPPRPQRDAGSPPAGDRAARLPEPRHATGMRRADALPAPTLERMLSRLGDGCPRVRVLYPNALLTDEAGRRCVVLHHGHYVEPVYAFFSRARHALFPERPPANDVESIERENFAWIDFVWSLLGRSGAAGEDAETLFEMLRYPERVRAFAAELADRAAPHVRLPFLPWTRARRLVLRQVLARVAGRLTGERAHLHEVCTPTTMRGIHGYLFGPAWRQVRQELDNVPEEVTFLFGHTHKPFEKVLRHPREGRSVGVINSGGWTVDTDAGSPAFGAAVVLMSARLEVASLRVYNDGPAACEVPLDVRVPSAEGFAGRRVAPGEDSFAGRVAASLGGMADSGAWRRLRQGIHAAVAERRMRHRARFGAPQPRRGTGRWGKR